MHWADNRPHGEALEQAALPRIWIAGAAAPPPHRFTARCRRCLNHFGTRAHMTVGELDIHRHAYGNGGRRPQRASGPIAHHREAARQHASIREGRKQLGVALATRPARVEKIVDGPAGALGKRGNAFCVARKPHPVRRNIGGRARP